MPQSILTVQFDGWGRSVNRKDWSLSYGAGPSGAEVYSSLDDTRYFVYDALGRMAQRYYQSEANVGDRRTFFYDLAGNIVEEIRDDLDSTDGVGYENYAFKKYAVWSPVTGELIVEAHDGPDNDNVYSVSYHTLVDIQGNTVAVLNSDGTYQSRFQHLFGQGRYLGFGYVDLATGLGHGGVTQLAGGLQYDALQNGVVKVIGSAFWDDVNDTAPKPVEYTWWERYGQPVADAWSTGVGYVTGAIDWVADRLDDAGGWLINQHLYTLVPTTALASGLTRFAGGIVGLADVPGLITGTMVAYGAYREEGLTVFESVFYASPVIGGIGQVGSQLVTGQSYAAHDFGRSLSWTERITNAAFALSIGAGGAARLGAVRAGGAAATPASTTPRSVPLKVLNGTERLVGGATNPALAQRFLAFQKYKRGKGLGPTDRVSRQQFEFFRRGNAGSNGGQFYPRRFPGSRINALRNEFNARVRPSYIQAFAGTQRAARMFNPRQLAVMQSTGRLPAGYVVHHIKPLYRGGGNAFGNLRVMNESFHLRHSDRLHNYPTGMNPYGRN